MRTYIKSSEFQSRSELLIIENCLPLTDEVTVDLVLSIALRNTRWVIISGIPGIHVPVFRGIHEFGR